MSQFLAEMMRDDLLDLKRNGSKVDQQQVFPNIELKGLVTALFFSDSGTKSVKFGHQLKQFYDAVNSRIKRIEIVFVPEMVTNGEKNGMKMDEYDADWLHTKHNNNIGDDLHGHWKCAVCKIIRRYKLHQSPYLCLIRPNGNVLYTCGVDDVTECFGKKCCLFGERKGKVNMKRAEFTVDYWCWMMGKDTPNWVVP